jgi:hypothetical protein
MELSTEDLTFEDIWSILSLVDEAEYRSDTIGGVEYHTFEVHWGTEINYGDDDVEVKAGIHQLLLDAHSREWIGYVKLT